jgi:hypothetical protein
MRFHYPEDTIMQPFRMLPVLILLLILPLFVFNGCGNDSFNSIPDGSKISVGPDHSQTGIAADTTVNYTIVAIYSDGTPIPNARVKVSGSFAVPRANPHYQFYLYPDGPANLTNVTVDSGFFVRTGDDGTYMFSALISAASGSFSDSIICTSGTAIGTAQIEVN